MEQKNKVLWLAGGIFVALLIIISFFLTRNENGNDANSGLDSDQNDVQSSEDETGIVEVIASDLDVPWGITFLPDDSMLVTERSGQVVHVESGKTFPISGVKHVGEGGLLGIALHPNFKENHLVYLYQTTELSGELKNRVVRYGYENNTLTFDRSIFENIPGARFHDGGRIAFGPDDMLYITTGDAGNEDAAQDTVSLSGKILRVRDDGSIPSDNPFRNAVWSYGHRNPQGLAWDIEGQLWSTEHGRSGVVSGYDEINLIQKGGNYGWPDNQGNEADKETKAPALHSTADVTWAPASAAFYGNSLFFGGLAGESLYETIIEKNEVKELRAHFTGTFGRIRDIVVGPDGFLYITTSNRDGRGDLRDGDDRILRIDPKKL